MPKEAEAFHPEWEGRAGFVTEEVEAFTALGSLSPDDVPAGLLAVWKAAAAGECDWYQQQLEEVERRIARHRYVAATRAKVEPIRKLLVAMERIIGSECYNGNIQNYSSWGVWKGEGRSFRYPVSVLRDQRLEKRTSRFDDLPAEELITGHYRFGANELGIYRALVRIVQMLESDYGFVVPVRGVGT